MSINLDKAILSFLAKLGHKNVRKSALSGDNPTVKSAFGSHVSQFLYNNSNLFCCGKVFLHTAAQRMTY